jgi:hypothetical protein
VARISDCETSGTNAGNLEGTTLLGRQEKFLEEERLELGASR